MIYTNEPVEWTNDGLGKCGEENEGFNNIVLKTAVVHMLFAETRSKISVKRLVGIVPTSIDLES